MKVLTSERASAPLDSAARAMGSIAAFGDSFTQPVRTERPFAMMENIRKMSVKNECKITEHLVK